VGRSLIRRLIRGWRLGPGSWLRCATVLGLFLGSLASGAAGQPTPAGTRIDNWAEASFEAPNGLVYSVLSDTLAIFVGQVAGVDIEPPRSSIVDPGSEVVFPHTLTNLGNGQDSFTVVATSLEGWPARLHLDADGDGALGGGDPLITGPVPLAMSENAALLAVVSVPGGAQVRGTIDSVRVEATSLSEPAVSDAVVDVIEVQGAEIVVDLVKSVDRATATIGDILTYTIRYEAAGSGSATNFEIVDVIPAGTSYLPGTLSLDGAPLTDTPGDDVGSFDLGADRVVFTIGNLSGGDTGTVSFQVRVDG